MSVIVMGMEMPENCLQCAFFSGQGCKATRTLFPDWMNVAVRAKECPIRPLPDKHGRLIDADRLDYSLGIEDSDIDMHFLLMECDTIVEAEGD